MVKGPFEETTSFTIHGGMGYGYVPYEDVSDGVAWDGVAWDVVAWDGVLSHNDANTSNSFVFCIFYILENRHGPLNWPRKHGHK